jgi:hypothetical protein
MKAKAKKVVKKSKPKEEMMFVLEGGIFLEEKKGGKLVSREQIDGKAVLQLLIRAVEDYCDVLLNERRQTSQQRVDVWGKNDEELYFADTAQNMWADTKKQVKRVVKTGLKGQDREMPSDCGCTNGCKAFDCDKL